MEKLSETKRVACVFTRPFRAMADIVQKPGFSVPVTCMIIVPLLAIIANLSYYRDQLIQTLASTPQFAALGLDAAGLASMAQIQLYVMLGLTPVQTLLGWLLFSLAVHLVSMPFGGEEGVGYKTILSITGYAFLTRAVLYVLSAINLYFAPDTVLTFSLHDLLGLFTTVENAYVTAALQQLSIFTAWEFAVVGVGLHAAKRIGAAKAAAVMVIVFAAQLALVCGQVALLPS